MKTYALAIGCALVAFVAMGYQMGLFSISEGDDPVPEEAAVAEKTEPQSRFPDDLVPACGGVGVAKAANYDPTTLQTHRIVFLFDDGKLHQEWQDALDEDWRADKVDNTELIVAVGKEQKTRLSIHHYANGAPPVTRYQYDLTVRVISAKTGKVLAKNRFVSTPRQVHQVESWETTAIGRPVTVTSVFHWVKTHAMNGFARYNGVSDKAERRAARVSSKR